MRKIAIAALAAGAISVAAVAPAEAHWRGGWHGGGWGPGLGFGLAAGALAGLCRVARLSRRQHGQARDLLDPHVPHRHERG